jgi:hypothetical protein
MVTCPLSEFSFHRMLASFVICVNPRSLDKLVKNNSLGDFFSGNQSAVLEKVVRRMVWPTRFEKPGIFRITPLRKLFEKYPNQLPKLDTLKFDYETVYHPHVATIWPTRFLGTRNFKVTWNIARNFCI